MCPVTNGQTASYDIVRGGNVIGHQTVKYAIAGPDMTVTVDVEAALHAMGIRVYHYVHHGEERWQGGQMVGLVTTTDDDGIPRHVDARRDPQSGNWSGIIGPQPGPAPLMASSLWNIQTISQTRLLDRETGEIASVRVTPQGQDVLTLGARQVNASKYELIGRLESGTAWYDANGCWVQALFHTRVDHSLIEIRAR